MAAWAIFAVWGVNPAQSGTIAHAVWEVVVLIVFFAWLAFDAVDIAIDKKIDDEGGYITAAPGEEVSGGGTSRVTTLFPLFRNFLLVIVVIIAGMVALAELGVAIAPLFARAGVLGLAIGFGAQSLIKDIFSGAFFLLDDAFRIGEYINVGSEKGSGEKISIRSMQLRHHRGGLHTIPFGEIKYLTNYSRDWVMMKLPLRVNYDTDVEKVRKLVKNLGKMLIAHPEVGHMFVQPLKSQGVFKMEDSAMIIRINSDRSSRCRRCGRSSGRIGRGRARRKTGIRAGLPSQLHALPRLTADRLKLVAVRVSHIGGIVIFVILRAQPGRALVRTACGERRRVKGIHVGPALGNKGCMNTIAGRCHVSVKRVHHEKPRTGPVAIRNKRLALQPAHMAEDTENRIVKGAGTHKIVRAEGDMTEHLVSPKRNGRID
jgi:small-conductance mechanosensitive channel